MKKNGSNIQRSRVVAIAVLAVAVGLLTAMTSALPAAELYGGASGIEVRGVQCTNLSGGTSVRSSDSATEWECVELGLAVEPGDRVAVTVRGRVAGGVVGLGGSTSVAPLFVTTVIYDEGGFGYATADFDLDDDQDILMTRGYQWLEQVAGDPAEFVPHDLDPPGFFPEADDVLTADFSGDGRPDLAATFATEKMLEWQENLGGDPPVFRPHTVFREPGWRPWFIEVGDLDSDGDPDLVSYREDLDGVGLIRSRLAWHENDGGEFTVHEIYESESNELLAQIFSVMADLDGDGDVDIAAADCPTQRILWFENDGGATPDFALHVIDADFLGPGIEAVDFDQDGDIDIMAGVFDDELRIYENLGGDPLGFSPHVLFMDAVGPLLGDLNGDGRVDIVADPGDSSLGLTWLENLGEWVFLAHDVRVADERKLTSGGVLADLDNDDDLDLVTNTSGVGETLRIEAKRTVGGWVLGAAADGVQCRNLSTGQTVRDTAPAGRLFDCEAMGLTVSPGDHVQITMRGTAE